MEVDDVNGGRKVSCLGLKFKNLGYHYYASNIDNFGSPKNSVAYTLLIVLFHIFPDTKNVFESYEVVLLKNP